MKKIYFETVTMVTTLTIQDLILYGSNRTGGKKVDMDAVLPYLILPGLLLIATISRPVTIIVMVVIGMGALYVHSRPRQKNRSSFFFSWTMSSGLCLVLVFECNVLGFFEVTQLENFIFLLLLLCTCYFFYKMKAIADFELATGSSKGKEYRCYLSDKWKNRTAFVRNYLPDKLTGTYQEVVLLYLKYNVKISYPTIGWNICCPVLTSDSHYCQICQIEVNERFFHSIWWDCCVLRPNYIYFLAGQVFAFATLLFGTNLGLTTVCQPFIFFGVILMPQDCDDVYYDFKETRSMVTM